WRSQKPSPLSGAVLGLVLIHTLRSILSAPVLLPRISSSNPLSPTTALCEKTWLRRLHSHILFTSRKNGNSNHIFLPHSPGSLWSSFSSKALFADRYLPHYFSWYIMTSDNTYVLVDDLMQ
ncbi:hypothetical protein GCK32_018899, partial [Trichostrongylus colubriformis]